MKQEWFSFVPYIIAFSWGLLGASKYHNLKIEEKKFSFCPIKTLIVTPPNVKKSTLNQIDVIAGYQLFANLTSKKFH